MNACKLRGIIAEKGSSQRKLAYELGISEKTFYHKMAGVDPNTGKENCGFSLREAAKIVQILEMDAETLIRVFFPEVAQ